MTTLTSIEWCDYSSNPIKYHSRETGKVVWACVKKSDGCTHCYSETLAKRWNKGLPFIRPNIDKVTPFLDEKEMRQLATDPKLSGQRVFIGDMTDIAGSWIPDDFLDHLFAVFAWRQDVTFQCLTKRPERMEAWFREAFQFIRDDGGIGWHGRQERVFERMQDSPYIDIDPNNAAHWTPDGSYKWPGWPLPNVWLGTSTEDQRTANERIPHLLRTPAAVRFLSCEPLLGPISLHPWVGHWIGVDSIEGPPIVVGARSIPQRIAIPKLHWIITGGESGHGARPAHPDWYRSLRDQCQTAGVAFHFKQWGEWAPSHFGEGLEPREGMASHYFEPPEHTPYKVWRFGRKAAGRLLDGVEWSQFPAVRGAAGAGAV